MYNNDFLFYRISPLDIRETIKRFSPKTSTDVDGISLKLIKYVSECICTPLSHIFNLSINTGTFPSALKLSRIVPLHKGGNPELCDN